MNKKLAYIEYNEKAKDSMLKNILSKIFFNIKISEIDENRRYVLINRNIIKKNSFIKLIKYLKKNDINTIVISKKINLNYYDFKNENIRILDGKFLMKNFVLEIVQYIFDNQSKDGRFEGIYITINNDKQKAIIFDLAKAFKSISIVTDNIKKLKRLEKKLDQNEEIISSISNNSKKSLKNANIIINFDYDSSFFDNFNVNRNAIIINLSSKKLKMRNGYQGVIIENIHIDYKVIDEYSKINTYNFEKSVLYESYIYNLKYGQIKEKLIEDKCKICSLIGDKGCISKQELKKF